MHLVFRKTGQEIKSAIQRRRQQLQQRLDRRNQALARVIADPGKVRSYMVRGTQASYGHGGRPAVLHGPDDLSSEEKEEITQLCQRVFELEQELYRLLAIETHLPDEQVVELGLDDLFGYGFEAGPVAGGGASGGTGGSTGSGAGAVVIGGLGRPDSTAQLIDDLRASGFEVEEDPS